ncbi:Zinc/iron permease [Astrocystis sublimbata]|nr:Zinc/iron permease [Astrocystis sublimbata]
MIIPPGPTLAAVISYLASFIPSTAHYRTAHCSRTSTDCCHADVHLDSKLAPPNELVIRHAVSALQGRIAIMAGGGVFLLLSLTVVMTLASFLAGALPLSMSLSQSQLRFIASIGVGILVGTSLIVIIPEGIEAIAEASFATHHHPTPRSSHAPGARAMVLWTERSRVTQTEPDWSVGPMQKFSVESLAAELNAKPADGTLRARGLAEESEPPKDVHSPSDDKPLAESELPTFYIGLSLILGFILMFLVDRLPRHASENLQPPTPRHISLSNLGGSSLSADEEEAEGFLGSLTPTPKQSRSLATTTGLVIHAAADGIAMGASVTSPDKKLGLIVFVALMVHKAPAAFGLTSILLKQGLSKRAARGHLIVFSLASPLGAWLTFILVSFLSGSGSGEVSQWWTGMLLLFSAGTFLYVAMHAMQEGESPGHDIGPGTNGYADGVVAPRKHAHPQMRETLATIVGMLVPALTQLGHHH